MMILYILLLGFAAFWMLALSILFVVEVDKGMKAEPKVEPVSIRRRRNYVETRDIGFGRRQYFMRLQEF